MKTIGQGIAYSGKDEPRYSSCAFPGLCELSDGTLVASFKGAERKIPDNATDRGVAVFSYDGGKTWSSPVEPFAPPVVDGKPTTIRTLYFCEVAKGDLLCVCNAVDATLEALPYYNEETEGLKDTYIMFSHSRDSGNTWEPLRRIQVETYRDLPLPLTGAPFLTGDGRVCIQFEVNKPYYEKEYWVHHSCAVFSSDGGYTWGDEVTITGDRNVYYWDQRLSLLDDGRLCGAFWTFDRRVGDYVDIHYSESSDGGRSFGPLTGTGLTGQPGNIISGRDESMLLVYINREKAPVIRIAESEDGRIWRDIFTVYDSGMQRSGSKNAGMNDVWSEMGAFNVGHPYMLRLKDGRIAVYFYSGPSTHRTDYHFVMLEE